MYSRIPVFEKMNGSLQEVESNEIPFEKPFHEEGAEGGGYIFYDKMFKTMKITLSFPFK